jgi:hypothetical protein
MEDNKNETKINLAALVYILVCLVTTKSIRNTFLTLMKVVGFAFNKI